MRGNLSCILECKNPLRFHLIIDKKHFGGEKNGELKSCDAGSLGGESSKLSEGILYFIICISTLTMTSKINVYKVKNCGNLTR